jgi:hypothetical protein
MKSKSCIFCEKIRLRVEKGTKSVDVYFNGKAFNITLCPRCDRQIFILGQFKFEPILLDHLKIEINKNEDEKTDFTIIDVISGIMPESIERI